MNIRGENIYEDADAFLNEIGIGEKIVIPVYTDEREVVPNGG